MPSDEAIKLFLALSEGSRRFETYVLLAKVAIHTALENTKLLPHVLYDGRPNLFTEWLEARAVPLIRWRTSLYPHIEALAQRRGRPGIVGLAAGAYLRTDMPAIARHHAITDRYVLYTDVDVMFVADPSGYLGPIEPRYFAVAPQHRKDDYRDMNSGVMWMNLEALHGESAAFNALAARRLEDGLTEGWDQGAYSAYFSRWRRRRYLWDRLPPELNWKPYWGRSEDAVIVHFHGPKPTDRERLASGDAPKAYEELFGGAYEDYSREWDIALTEAG